MALLRKGCCCCQLRTCVLAQAWFCTILSVLQVVAGLFLFALMFGLIPEAELPQFLVMKHKTGHSKRASAIAAQLLKYERGIQATILLINGCISLAVNIALIYGCKKENRRLLVPALICGAFALLFVVIYTIIMVITLEPKIAAIVAVIQVASVGIGSYMWLHVLSYYLELREEDKELKRQSL